MSNRSTNDTSHIFSEISVGNYLKNINDIFENEIKGFLSYYIDYQEKKDSLKEFIEECDKEYNNKCHDIRDCNCTKIDKDISLKFIKIKKNENEYNILDNYNIITKIEHITDQHDPKSLHESFPNTKTDTKTEPKKEILKTILLSKRSKGFKMDICQESYQINKKIKLKENLLLIILIKKKEKEEEKKEEEKKKEEKEKEKEEKKEKKEKKEEKKDKVLILLIKEKKIRDKEENKEEDKKEDKEEDKKENEENDKDKDKKEDEDKYEDDGDDDNEENENFKFVPDINFHIFYKKYIFSFEIPEVGTNFSSYLYNKNGKEEIILFFWWKKIVYFYKIENIDDDSDSIITKCTFNLDFEVISIFPIKSIKENKCFLKKDTVFFTENFLIITKGNFKLCKCNEKVRELFICNVEFEFKNEDDKKIVQEKNIKYIEQLDNGLIAIHLKFGQRKEIAYFYLYCKDYFDMFYKPFYKKMMFKIFLFKLKKKINNNN